MSRLTRILLRSFNSRSHSLTLVPVQSLLARFRHSLLPQAASLLNTLTGYDTVQTRKDQVLVKDKALSIARTDLSSVKTNYESIMSQRLKTQKEIHSLLQRQGSWTPTDVQRFTDLYKLDLDLEALEVSTKAQYKESSEAFDRAHSDYLTEIRERYIDEQIYSDKIRRVSTWWTMGLISFHLILFVTIQTLVEPRKKASLIQQVSLEMAGTLDKNQEMLQKELSLLRQGIGMPLVQDTIETQTHIDQVPPVTLEKETRAPVLSDPSFLQGLVLGSTLSFVSFVLFYR
jgi:hypothetical protein